MKRWYHEVEQEITQLILQYADDTTAVWTTAEIGPNSVVAQVADEFRGVQYSPNYEGEVWSDDKEGWLTGTVQAAQSLKGKGAYWTIDQICVLPRTADEAGVMYRVNHWFDPKQHPSRALFLETWNRQGGQWNLRRHTAEKASPLKDL